jgi:hypothetical protein
METDASKRRTRRSKAPANETEPPIQQPVETPVEEKPTRTRRSVLSKPLEPKEPVTPVNIEPAPPTKGKRGRKPKQVNPENGNTNQKEAQKEPLEVEKKKRGRKPKSFYETNPDLKPKQVKKTYTDDILSDEEESEIEEDTDDEEFKLEKAAESSEEDEEVPSEDSSESIDSEDVKILKRKNTDESIDNNSPAKKYNTRRSTGKSPRITQKEPELVEEVEEEPETPVIILDKFDMDAKFEKWDYELERESKAFRKPVLPGLSDEAIKPFVSSKSKPPKCVLYECPFCKRIFTYTLVFKNHLFSCAENKNVPKYALQCVKHPECDFTGQKKQEMMKHYNETHTGRSKRADSSFVVDDDAGSVSNGSDSCDNASSLNSTGKLTKTKRDQFAISQYSYVPKAEFKFSLTYFNRFLSKKFKRLNLIDRFMDKFESENNLKLIQTRDFVNNEDKYELKFKLPNKELVCLRPFEFYLNDEFFLFNFVNKVTALDWCPMHIDTCEQYLAFATRPLENSEKVMTGTTSNMAQYGEVDSLLSLYSAPNLINFLRMSDMNKATGGSNQTRAFSIFHKEIGK